MFRLGLVCLEFYYYENGPSQGQHIFKKENDDFVFHKVMPLPHLPHPKNKQVQNKTENEIPLQIQTVKKKLYIKKNDILKIYRNKFSNIFLQYLR